MSETPEALGRIERATTELGRSQSEIRAGFAALKSELRRTREEVLRLRDAVDGQGGMQVRLGILDERYEALMEKVRELEAHVEQQAARQLAAEPLDPAARYKLWGAIAAIIGSIVLGLLALIEKLSTP